MTLGESPIPLRSTGFPPVEPATARLLILGSLPSVESLRQQQYYAHPRNAFWPIMGELFDAGWELPYTDRLQRLSVHGVMLWDVLHAAHRPGSLDAAIDPRRMEVNDFSSLLKRHGALQMIAFNGATSEKLFLRHVRKPCGRQLDGVALVRLPSTSPAHAALSFEQKLAEWRTALCP
jgi:double-stranded uracil-DNA glycosylase